MALIGIAPARELRAPVSALPAADVGVYTARGRGREDPGARSRSLEDRVAAYLRALRAVRT